MAKVNARDFVFKGFPPDEGRKLAGRLLSDQVPLAGLEVDLRSCPPGLLISAFFNGFLQEVFDRAPAQLDTARLIVWRVQFPFQNENIAEWMRDFSPVRDSKQ